MFTEDQVSALLKFDGVEQNVESLKLRFKEEEVSLLEMNNHDFLSLIILTPVLDIALANGSISLMEEMAINQKARKMSKGGFFLQADPVVYALKYCIKSFDKWKDRFYDFLVETMKTAVNFKELKIMNGHSERVLDFEFEKNLFQAPYIFAQFMSTFFINDIEQTTVTKKISQIEYEKILEIGRKLKIDHLLIFKGFCQTFSVK